MSSNQKLISYSALSAPLLSAAAFAEDIHDGADHGGSSFPPFDPTTFAPTLFWLFVTFTVLYWLMSRVALPRVSDIIKTRNAVITLDVDKAYALQKKAEEAGVSYESTLVKAKANATLIGQQAKDEALLRASDIRARLEADLSVKVSAAEEKISLMKSSAMANVSSIASEAVSAIVEKLTGSAPSSEQIAQAMSLTLKKTN